MLEIKLTLGDRGELQILWPQDRPLLTIKLLELAKQTIVDKGCQEEETRIRAVSAMPHILTGN